MNNTKILKVLAPTMALSVFLAACSGGEDASTGDKKKEEKKAPAKQEITVLESAEIPSMDSVMAEDTVSFTMLNNVSEGLYRLDPNQEVVEGLADGEPEASEDGKTYTIKLKDAKWSNGDTVTAEDFVFAWRRAVDPKTASPYGPYMMGGKIKNATAISTKKAKPETLGITAVDEKTLKIELEKPIPFFKSLMAFGTFQPQNKKFVEEKGKEYASSADNTIGAGPFVIKGWDGPEDVDWTLEKNANYWDAANVSLDKISYNVQKDPQASLNMFQAGEADVTTKLAQQGVIAQIESDPQLVRWLEPTIFWLKFNQTKKELANVNIRKALQMSFDKDALAKDVLNNGSLAANYFIPSEFVKHPESGEDFRAHGEFAKFDAAKAKELWEKGLSELGVKEITLTYVTQDTETAKLSDAFIKDQMQKNLPGLKLELKQVPFAQKLKLEDSMDYDILFSGWGPDYLDPMTFSDLYVTDGGNNKTGYSSKAYDQLIDDASNKLATDPAKRWEALQQAEKLLLEEDAVIAPVYQRAANIMVRENVKGFTYHVFGPEFSFKWVKVE